MILGDNHEWRVPTALPATIEPEVIECEAIPIERNEPNWRYDNAIQAQLQAQQLLMARGIINPFRPNIK